MLVYFGHSISPDLEWYLAISNNTYGTLIEFLLDKYLLTIYYFSLY